MINISNTVHAINVQMHSSKEMHIKVKSEASITNISGVIDINIQNK